MSTDLSRPARAKTPADDALGAILGEIAVPKPVLDEARRRRDLVLEIAMQHKAARERYVSGSVAHGTHNKPLEDTDCGIKVDRRYEEFRVYGPDGGGKGPEGFIRTFAAFIEPRLRQRGYPDATVNLDGNRAIKFEFHKPVEIDDWGPVDPYVDLIVALSRAEGAGLWIPNRRRNGWDIGDPQHHTWLLTERDEDELRILRAHVIRLAKRAVKRDAIIPARIKVMCSWNLTALALEIVDDANAPLSEALGAFFAGASQSIAVGLTEDPSPVIEDLIRLPDGVTQSLAAARLKQMAEVISAARAALSPAGARIALEELYGEEIDAIRGREHKSFTRAFNTSDAAALTALGLPASDKVTRSHGA